ncbi:MAG TPA: GGDEF domain-containing protein [Acidimicrobiia bacterium]|nr:GGDEF domain-containing protein [Acidimicrobiia bacterium]
MADKRAATTPTGGPASVVDAPTGGEWAVWWATPWPARLYNAAVVVAAAVSSLVAALARPGLATVGAALALVAGGTAVVELGRLAEGGRVDRQRIHKGLSAWPLAGALLLPAGLAGWVAAAIYVHAWRRGIRITRWKWIGSWGIVTLAALAATGLFRGITGGPLRPSGSAGSFVGVMAAMAAFLAVEAAGLFVISQLNTADDERYLRAQLTSPSFYVVEAAVLVSGVLVAVLYRYWPGFLLLGGPISLLLQRGMLHQPLRHEARHDAKTGVLNCEAWRATAGLALGHQRRQEQWAAVVVVDLDHFKAVNDVFGHLAGDEVLGQTADAIVGCVRSVDLVGRFGGDEFCALLFCAGPDDALATAERIRSRIEALVFADPCLAVTASVGLATAPAAGAGVTDVLPELMAAADRALYRAKRNGRNQVDTAGPGPDPAPFIRS